MSELSRIEKVASLLRYEKLEYGDGIPEEISDLAKSYNLLIITGASDDLMHTDGAYDEEYGCWNGGTFLFTSNGEPKMKWEEVDHDDEEEAERYFQQKNQKATEVKAVWGDPEVGGSWSYTTSAPHATFDVMEDGELYCRGIVVQLPESTPCPE